MAQWVLPEETSFIQYLVDNFSEAGDGGNFKMPTFEAAAMHIAPLHQRGAAKTGKMCQTKYTAVSAL
jgi:hypothetical protein